MNELTVDESLLVKGGFSITGTLLSGFYRSINSLLELGRSFGTALRMLKSGKFCSI